MQMNNNNDTGAVEHLVIVGGGTAGWMAANAIGKVFENSPMQVTVVESSDIGTVGVGEATIPEILNFNQMIGVDEQAFLKFTHGTFKQGIEFVDWHQKGESYLHPFGRYGNPIDTIPFYHHWQKMHNLAQAKPLSEYCLAVHTCIENKFARPVNVPNSPWSEISYAYHFDASLYGQFLRQHSKQFGVKHIDGKVMDVIKNTDNGYIKSLTLESGQSIEADFFIDCSGFKGLLIEQALHTGYDDWSHYLPCNSAITVASPRLDPLPPYTRATALEAGWQWQIPLQHRTGNGYVYSDKFIDDEQAQAALLQNITGEPISEPKLLRFTTGMRRKLWSKNCLALGLSGGFLEPLESTSIHLVHEGIANFLDLFPSKKPAAELIDKFNRMQVSHYSNIRDFLILHYWGTQRRDSEFWNYCRTMDIPDRLREKVDLYRSSGRILREEGELFGEVSWISVLQGQGLGATAYNPIADAIPVDALSKKMEEVYQVIKNASQPMPQHSDFVERYCKSSVS